MIEFIFKALNWVCACFGAIILGTIGYSALMGDFGDLPREIMAISIGIIALVVFIEIGIGLHKLEKQRPGEN